MARTGFLTAGTWVVDRNIQIDFWPDEDRLGTVREVSLAGGGPGCNFGVAMRRLDPSVPVETQGLIGAGEMGDFLVDVADRHGIDHSRLQRTPAAQTQVTDAYLSLSSGKRTHVLFPGTGPLLTPDHISPAASQAKYLHLGLPGIHAQMDAAWGDDANGWVSVLKAGQAAGLLTNMELVTAPAEVIRRIVHPCLPHLDTLVVNDAEIGALAGRVTQPEGQTDLAACRQAMDEVLAQGAMALIVVHFPTAALALTRSGERVQVPAVAIPPECQVGPNGAGDAFAAGCFLGLSRDLPLETCLRMGHATAAASLRAADTYSGIDRIDACLDQASRWGWQDLV